MPSTEEELKKAMRAFKKRLKLTQLDDDSKIGHGPMSGGQKDKVVSIQPPAGFGREIGRYAERRVQRRGYHARQLQGIGTRGAAAGAARL